MELRVSCIQVTYLPSPTFATVHKPPPLNKYAQVDYLRVAVTFDCSL